MPEPAHQHSLYEALAAVLLPCCEAVLCQPPNELTWPESGRRRPWTRAYASHQPPPRNSVKFLDSLRLCLTSPVFLVAELQLQIDYSRWDNPMLPIASHRL